MQTYQDEYLTDEQIIEILKLRNQEANEHAFLEELHTVVPPYRQEVTTEQARDIYNIRLRYEPNDKRGLYKTNSVTQQVRAGTLKPLSSEEQRRIFGARMPRIHWFKLSDVLNHPLGRWPAEKRTPPLQKHSKRGRPRRDPATIAPKLAVGRPRKRR